MIKCIDDSKLYPYIIRVKKKIKLTPKKIITFQINIQEFPKYFLHFFLQQARGFLITDVKSK